jgi:phytoene synthase
MDALAWCRDRLLVPGNPLTASLPFADDEERDRILALRTVIGELGAAAESQEERVGQTRLEWWSSALAGELDAAQRHPAILAMTQSGATDRLTPGELQAVVDAIGEILESPRFERFEELWQLCCRVGGQALALEAKLLGGEGDSVASLRDLGSCAYLVRLVRDIAMDARAQRWWVPLELQAEYQLSRTDVAEGKGGLGFDGLIRTLLHEALTRSDEAVAAMPPDEAWRHRHALIYWMLDRRLALKLARRPAVLMERRVLPGHAGNVITAWRAARRLRRRAGA